ncbi:GAF domain-containing protein [Modestobacter sp. I12A-02662]|uniref:GAF domain-containing protein n=1 Tax=Modestobacter sp. I12A-02662 TaxID=1730496 RepID=UPI0034DFCC85
MLPARPDPVFDRLAADLAAQVRAPRAFVVLVSKGGQVFPGMFGLPEPWVSQRSSPLSESLSLPVVLTGAPLVIRDFGNAPNAPDSQAVTALGVVAYAGMPLVDGQGHPIGVLCAVDVRPRTWTARELAVLQRLAAECSRQLQLRAVELAEEESRAATRRADASAAAAAESARVALLAAEAEADRARLVARLSQALLPVETFAEVLRTVDRLVRSPLGATATLLGLGAAGSTDLRVWAAVTGAPPSAGPVATVCLGDEHPMGAAARDRRLVTVPSREEGARQFTALARLPAGGVAAGLAVPLVLGQHSSIGALMVGWDQERPLDESVLAAVTGLARHVEHAVDRVLLREQRLRLQASPFELSA